MQNIKRERIEPGPPAPLSLSYIDVLPVDTRIKLVEWLDVVSRASENEQELNPKTRNQGTIRMLSLRFSGNSPFRDVVSSLFTKVCGSCSYDSTGVGTTNGDITIGSKFRRVRKEIMTGRTNSKGVWRIN